jgi:hypothetical protein
MYASEPVAAGCCRAQVKEGPGYGASGCKLALRDWPGSRHSNEHRQRVGGGSLSCGGLDRGSSIEALPGLDGLSVSSRNGLPSRGYHGHVPELR